MLRYQRGDLSAFSDLVQRHKTPLFNFILRQLRSQPAAEDALQEVLLRVVQGCADFKHEARFATWLYTIARNHCIDELRKMSLRAHESLDRRVSDQGPNLGELVQDVSLKASVERQAASSELRDRMVQAIHALADEQREVFLLREIANLPFAEIAQVTGTPENTVKSRMRYALERLQEALNEYQDQARALR
jgi:RNA polymerase sigma-70 factor, ECF subfamily